MRQAVEDLSAENLDAWRLFQALSTRFLVETHAVSVALARLTADLDADDLSDVLTRLAVLYEAYYPPRRPASGA